MAKEGDPLERFIGILAGISSGLTKLIIGHPFDTVKLRMQVEGGFGRFKSPLDCLRQTVSKEGFFGLYKGSTPPALGWVLMDSVQWGALTNLRLFLQDSNGQLSLQNHCLAGLGAGITVSFVASPIEILKAKLQVQYDGKKLYSGPIQCAKTLIREDGIKGLYRGLSACLLFRSFFWVLWGSYEVYTRQLEFYKMSSSLIPFFAGGLAANTFWIFAFPFDVIKNRMMTRPKLNPDYDSISSCIKFVIQKEGIKGFYRGFVPGLLRSFPTNASAIFVFESMTKFGKSFSLE